MTKILWHSNAPWAQTGYGQQTALATSLMSEAGHDVAISAFWGLGGKTLEWNGMKVYPADTDWGNEFLVAYAFDHGKGDLNDVLAITLMDVWVLTTGILDGLNLAAWCPVDHDPVPPRVAEFFTRTKATPIAMSRFGERKFVEAGFEPLYVPHGIDTDVFKPTDGRQWKEAVGIDPDAFVVGMVAANNGNSPPRKGFPQAFEAFAAFHKQHPDSILYVHSDQSNIKTGLDLPVLAKMCGIPDEAIRFTPKMAMQLGIDPAELALIYSMFDVLVSPSYGEGFGIPIVEAQACGVPVIVNDCTAMTELAGPAQWLVRGAPVECVECGHLNHAPPEGWYNMSQGSWFQTPSTLGVLERLEQAYAARGDDGLRAACREFALRYDARRVFDEFWVPALEVLEAKMADRRPDAPMPAVALNREQRRRATRQKVAA